MVFDGAPTHFILQMIPRKRVLLFNLKSVLFTVFICTLVELDPKLFQGSLYHLLYECEFANLHCVKSVQIWSFSGLYFPVFGAEENTYLDTFTQGYVWFNLQWSKQATTDGHVTSFRGSRPEVLLRKGVLKTCSKFTGEHQCRSVISIKLLCNFIEITLPHGWSPVNLLHIFRTPLPKNTSGWLLLIIEDEEFLRKIL